MTKSDNMKAHTPAYHQHNDLAEAKLAKDEREKTYKLIQEARDLNLAYDDSRARVNTRAAIGKLCDALERILASHV